MTLALDLGTTRIKLASYDQDGVLQWLDWRPSPEPQGSAGVRITDPETWRDLAGELLGRAEAPPGTPLGIASQRSSFLLWEKGSGKPLTPLISWQDSSAAAWCQKHPELEARHQTGLPLSPHYAGPKLARLLDEDPALARGARAGDLLFGTLECWLIWCWSGEHITGLAIAARTTLVDLRARDWNRGRLLSFGIPPLIMPRIIADSGRDLACVFGFPVRALLADQAAAALPIFSAHPGSLLVNAGTGIFVMCASPDPAPDGYLTAWSPPMPPGINQLIGEGSINAGAALMQDLPGFDLDVPDGCFSVGDQNGLAAPFWRPDLGGVSSIQAQMLTAQKQREVHVMGLLFRIRQMVEDLNGGGSKVLLSGGLARHPFFIQALAIVLQNPLFTIQDNETGLWGTAWAARGFEGQPDIPPEPVSGDLTWDPSSYTAWKQWMKQITSGPEN